MKSYDILYGMEYVDTDLINKALNYGKKRRMYGIIKGLSVACLAVAVLVVGINVQNTLSVKNSDITMRFGMFPVSDYKYAFNTDRVSPKMMDDYMYLKLITENEGVSLAYGTVKNIKQSKTITDGFTWFITTFDLEIIRGFRNVPKEGVIKVIAVNCESFRDSKGIITKGYPKISQFVNLEENKKAFFTLWNENVSENWHTIGETNIKTFDYADYFLAAQGRDSDETQGPDSYEKGSYINQIGFVTFDLIQYYCDNKLPDEATFWKIYGYDVYFGLEDLQNYTIKTY